jgi:hypothetical protein
LRSLYSQRLRTTFETPFGGHLEHVRDPRNGRRLGQSPHRRAQRVRALTRRRDDFRSPAEIRLDFGEPSAISLRGGKYDCGSLRYFDRLKGPGFRTTAVTISSHVSRSLCCSTHARDPNSGSGRRRRVQDPRARPAGSADRNVRRSQHQRRECAATRLMASAVTPLRRRGAPHQIARREHGRPFRRW